MDGWGQPTERERQWIAIISDVISRHGTSPTGLSPAEVVAMVRTYRRVRLGRRFFPWSLTPLVVLVRVGLISPLRWSSLVEVMVQTLRPRAPP